MAQKADFSSPVTVTITLDGELARRLWRHASLGRTLDNVERCLGATEVNGATKANSDDAQIALEELEHLHAALVQAHDQLRPAIREVLRSRLVPQDKCEHKHCVQHADSFRYCRDCWRPWREVDPTYKD